MQENGKPFIPPNLSKRPKSKWQAPICHLCHDVVERWMYHEAGHVDGTPLILLSCHGTTYTFGTKPQQAKAFREEIAFRFASGLERLELNVNGTYNGPGS